MFERIKTEQLNKLALELEIPINFLNDSLSFYPLMDDILLENSKNLSDFNGAVKAFEELNKLIKDDPNGHKMFMCFLFGLYFTKQEYINRHISLDIFYRTMSTFKDCIVDSNMKYTAGFWVYRHTSLRLFTFGDFDYELYEGEDDKVVALHIHPKADLSDESFNKSLEDVKEFLKMYFPKFYKYDITLYSWIIDPKVVEQVPPTSKIAKFYSRFKIVNRHDEISEELSWIFHADENTKFEDLPENTTLQKNIKKCLLKGESFGVGFGRLIQ